jgi:hypothetical protein
MVFGILAGAAACGDPPLYDVTDAPPCPALGAACAPTPGAAPAITAPTVVAPSASLPPAVVSQVAHNNLDVIWHRGRLFFAFRTGPFHFAHEDVVVYVVSTADHEHWTFETSIALRTDVREPRFLAIGDRLFLYSAVLGSNPALFEPQYAQVIEQLGPGEWSEPERVLDPGFIGWRTKPLAGANAMLGYVGGENIYEVDGEPVRVSWLTTADGRAFAPAVAGQPVVLEGGSSETDAVVMDDGSIIAVSRNELGDASGWGMKLCRADAATPGDWQCVSDPKKYDSPLLFRHGADVYLIGRRNVTADGNYDLMRRELAPEEQTRVYEVEYWNAPKRCAVWKLDPAALVVEHVLDLPTSGDTCFPGMVELGGGRYLIYDYTSPLDADIDRSWRYGQFGPTSIYWVTLTLP